MGERPQPIVTNARPKKRDWGRFVARTVSLVFFLLGLLPLVIGITLRTNWAKSQISQAIQSVLWSELGLKASFQLSADVLPLGVELRDVQIDSTDGSAPVLTAQRVRVAPRLFRLLAGQPDAGDITVDQPSIHLVLANGELKNLQLKLKKKPATEPGPKTAAAKKKFPLRSVHLNGLSVGLLVDDQHIETKVDETDADLSFGDDGSFDAALTLSTATIQRQRTAHGNTIWDDDRLCTLRARVHFDGQSVLVRRAEIDLRVDRDAAKDTFPNCGPYEELDDDRVFVSAQRLRVTPVAGELPRVEGKLALGAPLDLVGRFLEKSPITGVVKLETDLRFDGRVELPTARAHLLAKELVLFGERTIAHHIDARIETTPDTARIEDAIVQWSGGWVELKNAKVQPLAKNVPVDVEVAEIHGLRFPSLMSDLGVTQNTIVQWDLEEGTLRNFKGHAADEQAGGPVLMGDLAVRTSNFEVFDKAYHNPKKEHVIAVKKGYVKGKFGFEPNGVVFKNVHADCGRSQVSVPWVLIGFKDALEIDVGQGSHVDFADITPIGPLELGGTADVTAKIRGPQSDPKIEGVLHGKGLRLDELVLADHVDGSVFFKTEPNILEFRDMNAIKGNTNYKAPLVKLDFDRPGGIGVDASAIAKAADIRDLLAIFNLNNDPRYAPIDGHLDLEAKIRFEDGGPRDECGTGVFMVEASAELLEVDLIGERFDGGSMDIDFVWFDRDAEERGMDVNVRNAELRKGPGTMRGSATIRRGGEIRAHAIAHDLPVSRLGLLDPDRPKPSKGPDHRLVPETPSVLQKILEGSVHGEASLSGKLDALALDSNFQITSGRVGKTPVPASTIRVRLDPTKETKNNLNASVPKNDSPVGTSVSGAKNADMVLKSDSSAKLPKAAMVGKKAKKQKRGLSKCNIEIPQGFDKSDYEKDESDGKFRIDGALFGGKVRIDDFTITKQRASTVTGKIIFDHFDLAPLIGLAPPGVLPQPAPSGELSATIQIDNFEAARKDRTLAHVLVDSLRVQQNQGNGGQLILRRPAGSPGKITLENNKITLSPLAVDLVTKQGVGANFSLSGSVEQIWTNPNMDIELKLPDTDIRSFTALSPKVQRASGKLGGAIRVQGSPNAPVTTGELGIDGASLQIDGVPWPLEGVTVLIKVANNEIRVVRAMAKAGTGALTLTARAPLHGFDLGELTANLVVEDLTLPFIEGVDMAVDASLSASWQPAREDGPKTHPRVSGSVDIARFIYTRPITVRADLDSLAKRGKRTHVELYDPDDDQLEFSLAVRAKQPLVFRNNVLEASVNLDSQYLLLSGTNQRFGMQGALRIEKGGHIRLRANEFDIRQGGIRFEDASRVAPRVDLYASTDYRRYTSSATAATPTTSGGGASAGGATGGGSAGGSWRITLHAYGDADDLKIELSSEPALPQDDLLLLLTIGLTRAELDQLQASNLGSTAALEALSTLSGADTAVKTVLPIVDDFRFGSIYSTRTGRTEPTVTVGKRISEQVRANITSGLSENRDVRSNIEWRLSPSTSVLGNYDNLNDVTSQGLGNLGADFRIRLEF